MSEVITPVTVIGDSAIGGTATVDSGDISVVAGNLSAIDIVSNNIDSVVTDANSIDSINTLAASNSQLVNLNSNLSTIETVNSKLEEINRYYTTFLGSSATDPTVRVDGSPLQVGDMYYSTTMPGMKVRGATAWATSAGGVPVNNSTLTGNTSIQNLTVSNAFNANGYAQFNSSDAFKIPSGTTAQRPTPAGGQLRFNTTTGEFEGYNGLTWGGIGGVVSGGSSATAYVRQTFTAAAAQTTFTVSGGYTPGKIDVFKNGLKLVNGTTVTVTSGSTVVLSTGASAGDTIDVVGLASGYFSSPATPKRLAFTATAAQTLFSVSGGYTPNQLDVFQNGTKLVTGTDVDVSNGTSFTLVTPATAGDTLEIVGFTAADTIAGTLKFQAGTAAAPSITTFEDTDTGVYFPAANTLAVTTNGVQRASIDGSGATSLTGTLGVTGAITASTAVINVGSGQIYKDASGNVGIGTTSPGTRLDVVASANSGIRVTNGTMTGILFNRSDTSIAIGSQTNHPVNLYANNSIAATISTSGNVGIGTESPQTKLHIATGGAIQFDRPDGTNQFRLGYTANDTALKLNFNAGSTLAVVDNNGNVGIGVVSPTAKLEVGTAGSSGSVLRVVPDGANGVLIRADRSDTSGARHLAFGTDYNERFRIDSSGNVGIGTTSPTVKLDVSNGNIQGKEIFLQNAAASSPALGTTPSWYSPASGVAALSTNANERLRIDSSGNVGIGVTNPDAKLAFSGTVGEKISLYNTSNKYRFGLGIGQVGTSFNTKLYGADYADAGVQIGVVSATDGTTFNPAISVIGSGNVGIGTTTPATKLHTLTVNPTSANEVARFQGGANASNFRNYISLYTTNPDYWWELSNQDSAGNGSGNGFAFRERSNAASVERLYIAPGGNVGIGTTNPGSRLEVIHTGGQGINCVNNGGAGTVNYSIMGQSAGSASVNTGIYASAYNASYNYGVRIVNPSAGTSNWAIYSDATAQSYFAGNVGIGVTAPVNKLEVVGSFGRGAPVTKTADFTLADTENWIIVNKAVSTCTVTLPAASSWTGREFTIKTLQAFAVVSATPASVVPRNNAAAGTAILGGAAGNWATLVSNGTAWVIMCGS